MSAWCLLAFVVAVAQAKLASALFHPTGFQGLAANHDKILEVDGKAGTQAAAASSGSAPGCPTRR